MEYDDRKEHEKVPRLPRKLYHPDSGKRICGARCEVEKVDGKYVAVGDDFCESTIVMANGRCRMHNGGAVKGSGHPSWKHGRHSIVTKALPEKLREAYKATMADPNALSLLGEVAVLDSRQIDLYEKLNIRESSDGWLMFKDIFMQLGAVATDLREEVPMERLTPLFALIQVGSDLVEKGVGDKRTWDELYEVMELRKKLTEAETKRQASDELALDRKQIVTFVGWLVHTLMEHVKDRDALTRVLNEVEKLLGTGEDEIVDADFTVEE